LSGLLRCAALRPATRSRIIGPRGGTIEIGPHKLVIPAGALSSPVTITVVIKSENVNRIHFEPHGLEFAQPAILTMSYGNCGKGVPGLPGGRGGRAPVYRIVYVSPTLDIIQSLLSIDDGRNRVVSATLEYLASDYAVDDTAYSDHATWW
jgi:hypothetical protein